MDTPVEDPLLIRCLPYMYTNQHLNVSWNNSISDYVSTTAVVKQGGILSLFYFLYIFELNSLIAPSIYTLNKMCDICLEFASKYDFKFNRQNANLLNMTVVLIPRFV